MNRRLICIFVFLGVFIIIISCQNNSLLSNTNPSDNVRTFDFEDGTIPFNAPTGKLSIVQKIPTNKVLRIESMTNTIFLIRDKTQFTIEFNLYLTSGLYYMRFLINDGIENKVMEIYGIEQSLPWKYMYTIFNINYDYQTNDNTYKGELVRFNRILIDSEYYFDIYLNNNKIGHILDRGDVVTDFMMYFTRPTYIDNFKIY